MQYGCWRDPSALGRELASTYDPYVIGSIRPCAMKSRIDDVIGARPLCSIIMSDKPSRSHCPDVVRGRSGDELDGIPTRERNVGPGSSVEVMNDPMLPAALPDVARRCAPKRDHFRAAVSLRVSVFPTPRCRRADRGRGSATAAVPGCASVAAGRAVAARADPSITTFPARPRRSQNLRSSCRRFRDLPSPLRLCRRLARAPRLLRHLRLRQLRCRRWLNRRQPSRRRSLHRCWVFRRSSTFPPSRRFHLVRRSRRRRSSWCCRRHRRTRSTRPTGRQPQGKAACFVPIASTRELAS